MIPFQETIDQILEKTSPATLRKAREILSETYRSNNSSASIFSDEAKKLAYLATRFPATYAATQYVLAEIVRRLPEFQCTHFLDLGAGPATASLAAKSIFPDLKEITLIERSVDAIALGKQLLDGEWICKDLTEVAQFPKASIGVISYCLGEIKPNTELLKRLWKADIEILAIIEPGTPIGYKTILQARDFFLKEGGHIVAPCPHAQKCPLKAGDWCHFSQRLERTKLHRLLKEGSLGFEDEKFSYLVIARSPTTHEKDRILRHPKKGSGHVHFTLCTKEGTFEERVVSRKSKEIYKQAKDAEWGDSFG